MRTLPWTAVAVTLSLACGGSGPNAPDTQAPAPVAPAAPATPSAAPAAPGGGASPGTGQCSDNFNMVNGRIDYDEACGSRSRQCTLELGGSDWSCLCTAASGAQSACQTPAPQGAVTLPTDCCPAG